MKLILNEEQIKQIYLESSIKPEDLIGGAFSFESRAKNIHRFMRIEDYEYKNGCFVFFNAGKDGNSSCIEMNPMDFYNLFNGAKFAPAKLMISKNTAEWDDEEDKFDTKEYSGTVKFIEEDSLNIF